MDFRCIFFVARGTSKVCRLLWQVPPSTARISLLSNLHWLTHRCIVQQWNWIGRWRHACCIKDAEGVASARNCLVNLFSVITMHPSVSTRFRYVFVAPQFALDIFLLSMNVWILYERFNRYQQCLSVRILSIALKNRAQRKQSASSTLLLFEIHP